MVIPNANKADHSVGTRDEFHESEASEAFDTMLPQKSLASSSIWSVSFRPGCEFCVSECHQKGVKSSTEECVLFLLVCPSL